MMILSRHNLKSINSPDVVFPEEKLFDLPEKVLQFGTGVLLRGLPDYYIDKANRRGVFNGRIAVVKSTDTHPADDFALQDNLYTLHLKGVEENRVISEQVVCSAISRVLSATHNWESILQIAHSEDLQIIISNTTEVGIQFVVDDIHQHPPVSFPGKLLAILYERYKTFNGSPGSGLVIIPTELIVDNGKKLEAIVLELVHLNKLELKFTSWLKAYNHFCNSLVDRIVPGKPDAEQLHDMEQRLAYSDSLRTVSETYGLWAIQGDKKIANVLSFSKTDKGVVVVPDIELYRELKLRLLNGTHTLTCGIAYLAGFKTVREAMDDTAFTHFITQLMLKEIAPAIPYEIDPKMAAGFSHQVLDRFRNPYIEHQWISISAQYASKLKTRVIPLLLNHYKLFNTVPECFVFGFAAFLSFMMAEETTGGKYKGSIHGEEYTVTDSHAGIFQQAWKKATIDEAVTDILKNVNLWDSDLTLLPGFANAVTGRLTAINLHGSKAVLNDYFKQATA